MTAAHPGRAPLDHHLLWAHFSSRDGSGTRRRIWYEFFDVPVSAYICPWVHLYEGCRAQEKKE